ncbi:NAD(P)H-binding protein [Nocardia cyriacigeorgica]|uniref:SDR family oxidoreductase n=1 Tax=Nocardia cyriacigeorgica TaxID=135487 RepID=UPI0013B93741|nr:NAD(P)H-binding protein [Nocardia cyriacigeorgica]NEW40819.1 NAD(P)H-binding protein [Nocardia cyriacigeorgica]NEW50970.1 NAD(P)H-binding protein [Nocardia cyriacigeorgica]
MILVTGASGKVGREAVEQLHKAGVDVRALVRRPESAGLPAGVEVVRGDLSDPGSLDGALEGVHGVFLVWPTLDADAAAPAVVRLLAERARHVVYLSAMGADEQVGGVAGSHGYLERLIDDTGVGRTFVRAGGFAGNDLGWAESIRTEGVVREHFDEWRRSVIHERDIAAVGVQALLEGRTGTVYEVTGPELLTAPQRAEIIADVIGVPVRFEKMPREEMRAGMSAWMPVDEVDNVLREMDEKTALPEPVLSTVAEVTGAPAHTYREWVTDHMADFR